MRRYRHALQSVTLGTFMPGTGHDFCWASGGSLKRAVARMDRPRHSQSSRGNVLRLLTLLALTLEVDPLGPSPPDELCPALDTPRAVHDNIGRECFTTDKYFHSAFTAGELRL